MGLGSPQEPRGLVCNSQQLLSPMEGAGWGSPQATPPNPSSVSRFAPLSLPPGVFVPQIPSPKHRPLKGLETFLPSHGAGLALHTLTGWRQAGGGVLEAGR